MEPRQQPTYLRYLLNLCGPIGLAVTLFGWVSPLFGVVIIAVGLLYTFWEFAPKISDFVFRRQSVSFLIFVLVGASVGAMTWAVWKARISDKVKENAGSMNIRSQPPTALPPSQNLARPEKVAMLHSQRIDNSLSPFVRVRIFNNAMATITNMGEVPIVDVQIDSSTQTVDSAHLVPGQSTSVVPRVTTSNYWSNAFRVRQKALNPGESDHYDLTRMVQWKSLPDGTETASIPRNENLDEVFKTFFVFRFTFRHAGTGEKYACYKIHGSYLKYPSPVDDNVAQGGSSDWLRFYDRLKVVVLDAAKERYQDGAKEIQCEN